MPFLKRQYDIDRDIGATREELAQIEGLREIVNHPAWKQIDQIITAAITQYTQDIFALCRDPKGNEIEIRCKRMIGEALGSILALIRSRAESADRIRANLDDKVLAAQSLDKPNI